MSYIQVKLLKTKNKEEYLDVSVHPQQPVDKGHHLKPLACLFSGTTCPLGSYKLRLQYLGLMSVLIAMKEPREAGWVGGAGSLGDSSCISPGAAPHKVWSLTQ